MQPRTRHLLLAAACGLALAGCGKGGVRDVAAVDRELVGNEIDPALTSALEDQIMVDPTLAQQKESAAARPGASPGQSPVPVPPPSAPPASADAGLMHAPPPRPGGSAPGAAIGQLAQGGGKAAANAECYRTLQYSAGWAQRLPAELPLYPGAQVSEAAGAATPGCNVRVVSFASGAGVDRVVDYYYTHAKRAGFSAEHQASGGERMLAGDKGDAAYFVTFRARAGGGSDIDLLTNWGR